MLSEDKSESMMAFLNEPCTGGVIEFHAMLNYATNWMLVTMLYRYPLSKAIRTNRPRHSHQIDLAVSTA